MLSNYSKRQVGLLKLRSFKKRYCAFDFAEFMFFVLSGLGIGRYLKLNFQKNIKMSLL